MSRNWPGNDPKIQEIPLPEHSKGLLKIFQQLEDDIKEILSEMYKNTHDPEQAEE